MVEKQARGAARGPGRPREERVTRAVLDAVVALVVEQGMSAVTMDAVAVRAEVSKPAIYRRWHTKQDLIIAAAESRVGPLSVPDLGDFRAELRAVLMSRVEAYGRPGADRLLAGVIGAAAEAGAGRSAYGAYTARGMAETRRILERHRPRGRAARHRRRGHGHCGGRTAGVPPGRRAVTAGRPPGGHGGRAGRPRRGSADLTGHRLPWPPPTGSDGAGLTRSVR
ncbi:helix-turn-helix domain-containing protein [Streptomyces sp. NPDC005181]|uniref:TetR/AcrR family transcriptional regulator n=1 Tax=Streptomyces sp. NPDC005181 TaxID=3156869 RepID=UPI0033A2C4FD